MRLQDVDASERTRLLHMWRLVADGGRPPCRGFSCCCVACDLEPHVQQLPQFKLASGPRAHPAREESTTIRADAIPARCRQTLVHTTILGEPTPQPCLQPPI